MSFLSSLRNKADDLASRAYDQANTLDNGRTAKQRTPTNNRSAVGQLTHNGATNTFGNLVAKPFVINPAQIAAETGRMAAADITNNPAAQRASLARQKVNLQASIPGFLVNQGINAGQGTYNLAFKAPILDTFGHSAAAERARVAGLQEFNRTVAGQAVRPIEFGIANAAHANRAAQQEIGLDPNATGAQKYIGDPLMGTIGTIGLAKGGEAALTKASPVVMDAAGKLADANARMGEGGFVKVPGGIDKIEKSNKKTIAAADKALAENDQIMAQVDGNGAAQPPVTPPPVEPPLAVQPPAAAPKVVMNKLTKGAKDERQNISPQAQELVQGEHAVRNTQALQDTAVANADKLGLDKTIEAAHEALAVKPGKIDDSTVALAQQAIERADAAGKLNDAVGIHDALSEHLVKMGQSIQAASLLYRLSPQGMFYKAMRDLKKSGTKPTPELEAALRDATEKIKAAADGDAKNYAKAEMQKLVADNMPKGAADSAIAVWKAGLLSGPLTQAGNFASNATFATLHGLSNPLATAVDSALSLITKQRTKTLTARGYAGGMKEGGTKGLGTMRSGIDTRNIGAGKFDVHGELNFKSPVIQKVFGNTSNFVFRGMNAADQPFYFAAFRNNLVDIAKAEGMNKGLNGSSLDKFVKNTVANPTTKMAETAKLAAQKSVLGQDNKLASAFSQFAQVHPAVQVLAPFVKVPTNFLARTLDFTPVGYVKAAVNGMKGLKRGQGIDQRALSEAIGEATTGTALIYLGAELANHNLISGQYPTNDQKEATRWKAEGIQPNSVKIGKTWVSLNYLGPIGMLFSAGNDYHKAASKGDSGTIAAIAGMGKSLEGQSFLTGLSGFADAINDPQRSAKSFVNSEVGSIVPSWSNTVANVFDSKQRETNTAVQGAQTRIPGLRNKLAVKEDVYGNPLDQRTGPLNILANPLRPSDARSNPVIDEVSRLHYVDPNNSDLQVTPTPVDKSIKVNGQDFKLNDSQRHDLQEKVGQTTQKVWGELIKTPQYQALSDADKAASLDDARKTATELAQRTYVTENSIATYNKAATAKAAALGSGTMDISQFAKVHDGSGSGSAGSQTIVNKGIQQTDKQILNSYNAMSTQGRQKYFDSAPDAEYKYQMAKYNNDKANGTMTTAQDAKAQYSLAKSQIGSKFAKETRDLYGLNKTELYNVLKTNKNGSTLADQIVAYGDALESAGLGNNKFRDSKGNIAIAPKSKSSGGRKTAKTKSQSSLISALSSSAKAAANAKVGTRATFANKVRSGGRGLKAYSKGSTQQVAVKKQAIRSLA